MEHLYIQNLFSVRDMVFVVTGGGSGLGEMMALALDANGASKVFVLGRRLAALERTAGRGVSQTGYVDVSAMLILITYLAEWQHCSNTMRRILERRSAARCAGDR